MTRFLTILIGIALFFVAMTYLLWRIFRGVKIVKYVPSILCFFISAYFLYLAKTVHVGFEDLANAALAVMFFVGFITGLATCLILDFLVPKFKN